MLKNLKRAAAIVLSFAMAIQFGLANSYYVNAEEEPVEPQQEQTTTVENNSEVQEEDANEVVMPETKSVELSYVAEDGTILQAATYRDFDLNYGLNTDSSVMLNFDGYTLKDVIVNNSQTVSADQASLSVTSDLVSVKFVYVSVNTKEDKQTSENNEQTKTEEASEDDAEADPETKEELVEYPAFDQSEMAGDVVVHATAAEGVLPRDSKLVVKRITRKAILNAVEDTVSEKNKEMDSAVALDITIQNKDGVEIQPNGSVNISFENAAVSGDEINVYHVTDDASAVTEVATNTQSFDANHFSIYVITGEKEKPLTTFNFVDAKGQIVSTQIVKTGDELITPTAPDVAGKAFVGWYEGETKFEDFNTALTITETKTRTITAKYENALYVYFYNPAGTQIMRTEKVGDHEVHGYTDVSYDVDSTHKLVGWAAERNGTENIADKITVPEGSTSVNVYAIIKEGYWVSFDSDGGSIVDSQFVLHGDTLTLGKDTTPTKPGYTFDGWYNGLSKVENGATVASSMTLTAHWKAAQVNYTVIHWWENADDDGYSFHESETRTGLTGTEVNAAAKSYNGFTAQPVTKKTIKGDGSTIVSVYYKRNIYKVEFFDVRGRTQYKDLTIEAKYGQDISKQWPTKNESSSWLTKPNGSTFQANIATMPLYGAKFYGPKTGYGTETASYYVQVLPGETGTVKMDGIQYKLDHKDASPGSYYGTTTVTEEDQYPLKGYTFNEGPSTKIGKRYDGAKFYYTRNSYNLKFINNGKQDKTVSKKYEQSISSENYTPVRPGSLPDYYEFDGWYDNELCEGEAFDFNGKKMPAQNVTLYAKWTAKKINLTYNLNNPEGDVVKGSKNVEAGTIANTVLPSATTTRDYSFAGWYYADGNGNITSDAYNTNEAITKDTSVIGKWLYNGELKVVYDPGTEGTNAKVPTDSNIYAGGAKVTVAKNAITTSKKKFLGWKLNGNLYHPGDAFEVNKDLANDTNVITLTAVWGSEEHSTTMSYNPGNGQGSVQTVPVKNNESVTLKSEKDFGYQAREVEGKEYYFAGWATSMEDANNGKATYAAGQTVHVDVNGENVLYATWVEKTVITLFANSNTVPYTGQMQEVNGFVSLTIDGYTVSGLNAHAQGTDVGTYPTEIKGTAHVEKGNQDVTNKVVVKTTPGQLTITKAETMTLTPELTGKDAEKEYDSKPLSGGATASVTKGTKITYSTDGGKTWSETLPSITNVGTLNVTAKAENKNYKDVTVDYTLKVTRKAVTVTADNKSKVFGEKDPELTATVTGTIGKDTVEYTLSRKAGEDVGTYTITPSGKAEQTNYKVTYATGTLTITKAETMTLTPELTGKDAEKEYDSKPLSGGATASVTKGTKITYSTDGGKTWSETLPSITNVGTLNVTAKAENKNYKDVTVDYTLKVTRKAVTVTADNKSKVFGEKDPELTATVTGTIGKDTVEYTLSRKAGEDVGTYTITPSGKAEQTNYKVTYATGTLTITSQSIDPSTDPEKPNPDYTGAKVNSPSDEVYDGKEHKWIPTVTDKADKKLEAGKDYTVEYSTKNFKDVGTIDVTITGIGNYTGTVTRTYKITPKSVTVKAEDKTKVFGETDPKLTAKVDGTLGNDTVDYKLSRKDGEAAGKYEITVKGDKLQGNYTVTYATGTLTITSQSIDPGTDPEKPNPDYTGAKVNSPSDEVYDGKEHKWIPTVTDKADKKLEAGKDYTVEYSTKNFKDVGTIDVTITGIGNYSGTVKRSYKVTPKEYTVTTDSATKIYSGTALTAGGKVEGIVSGETVEFTTTGSQTEVGSSKNTYELVWKSAKATNYTLAKESIGKLTVKAKSIVPDDKDTPESDKTGITVSEPSDSKYDGKEHREVLTVTDTKTGKELVAGTDYSVTYSSDLVNAGTVKVTVAGLGNYSGSFTKTYKITKRSVTLTSATVSKVYDGSALTNTSITVSGDGFVEGEGASYEVTGSQTEVGNSANSFEYKLNENTLASNYDITKVVGTLTVTAAPAPATPATPGTPSSTTSTTPRTPSAPQVTTPIETVEKETTPKAEPKKEEKVEEEYTPKASPQYYWALINLICAIVTVLFGLLLLISKRHKSEDDDEEDDETKQQTNNDDEEKEQEKKRGLFTRVLAVLIAIVSVVFFLVTEDLSLPWTWTDQWTIWMVVIGLVQIVVFFVGRKWKNVDDDEDEEEAQQA
ncbi:MBG domain-containing protein [Holdemanella biformis]